MQTRPICWESQQFDANYYSSIRNQPILPVNGYSSDGELSYHLAHTRLYIYDYIYIYIFTRLYIYLENFLY